tara:strand:+ start:1265 stop:1714 length:450 start_codon:yes stop_codon:yes gene_type:complete
MKAMGFYNITVRIISLLYIVLFVYTASSKLIHLGQFQLQLERFPFISSYATWIAIGVPLVELVVAGLFLFEKYILTALYASISLMVFFTTYIIMVLSFSDSIPCSCGGVVSSMGWKTHIIFNSTFIILALIGILLIRKKYGYISKQQTT